jgi:hypothetical protein
MKKKLLLLLIFLLIPLIANSGMVIGSGSSAACDDTTGMLIYTDQANGTDVFDVTTCANNGTDNDAHGVTWTCGTPTNAVNNLADATATNMRGTSWIRMTGGSAAVATIYPTAYTASGEVYFHFLYKPVSALSTRIIANIDHNAGYGIMCTISLHSSGQIRVQASGGSAADSTEATPMAAGSVYHVFGYFNKGSGTGGTNTTMQCWADFTPLATSTSNLGAATTAKSVNGTHDATDAIGMDIDTAVGKVDSFDQVRVKATSITSVCP